MNSLLASATKKLVNSCHMWHRWNIRSLVLFPLFLIFWFAEYQLLCVVFLVVSGVAIFHLISVIRHLFTISKLNTNQAILNKTRILIALASLHIVFFLFPVVFGFIFYILLPAYLIDLNADKSNRFDWKKIDWRKIFIVDTVINGVMCKDLEKEFSTFASTPAAQQPIPFPLKPTPQASVSSEPVAPKVESEPKVPSVASAPQASSSSESSEPTKPTSPAAAKTIKTEKTTSTSGVKSKK